MELGWPYLPVCQQDFGHKLQSRALRQAGGVAADSKLGNVERRPLPRRGMHSVCAVYTTHEKKRNNNCNWPQLNTYCGCLELSTGIYIRSVIVAVAVVISLIRNCYLLVHLWSSRENLSAGNFSDGEGAELDLDQIISILRLLEIYFISWIVMIVLYILFLIVTVYAVYKKKPKVLKFIVYTNIPLCVFSLLYSFFIMAINELLYGHSYRIFLLISYVLELYNFLAIRSYYKRIRGKSLLVVEENLDFQPPIDSTRTITMIQPTTINESNIEIHCRSCTCFRQENIPITEIVTTQPAAIQHHLSYGSNEEVNEEDNREPNQSVAENVQETNSGATAALEGRVIKPNTLDLSLKTAKEDKIDLCDVPVIYDEQQLNVGSSPVIEDRTV
ncbi:unnamed protein product, partial [Brenthis ino]